MMESGEANGRLSEGLSVEGSSFCARDYCGGGMGREMRDQPLGRL